VFKAFQSSAFRRYFVGQCISLTGTWMQQTAVSWLVYAMTGSAVALGWIGFIHQLPTLLVTPWAGVMADRVSKHKALLWTQVAAMAQAGLLAWWVATGQCPLWGLYALTGLLGIIQAVDNPVRQSYVPSLFSHSADKALIPNAVALNSATFNAARLVGPMVAGWLIVQTGSATSIGLNALSYVAVIVALLGLPKDKPTPLPKGAVVNTPGRALWQGVQLAWRHPWLQLIYGLIVFCSLFVMPYTVLLPVMAVKVFHGGPAEYGMLLSAAGCGSFLGAVVLATRQQYGTGVLRIAGGCGLMGLGLLGFASSSVLFWACVCLGVAGFGWIIQMASCNMRLQQLADDSNRGRIMSLYSVTFIGFAPLGSMLAGGLAQSVGPQNVVLSAGVCCLLASGMFWHRARRLQPVLPLVQGPLS
jgi:MFS family permease